MRIGIVADIHEHIDELRRSLDIFRERGVDTVVNLGDACDYYSPHGRALEVVSLLKKVNAVGVWGNHDFGFCYQVPAKVRDTTHPEVLAYMGTMKSDLVIGDCHFSHVEPWLDPYSVEQLWYFDGVPDTPEKIARSFNAVAQRRLFMGHFHRRLAFSARGPVEWKSNAPLELDHAERYLIVAAPVCSGACAIYDTTADLLTPLDCR